MSQAKLVAVAITLWVCERTAVDNNPMYAKQYSARDNKGKPQNCIAIQRSPTHSGFRFAAVSNHAVASFSHSSFWGLIKRACGPMDDFILIPWASAGADAEPATVQSKVDLSGPHESREADSPTESYPTTHVETNRGS